MSKPSKSSIRDAEYLKQDEIGLVIAKAMAVTYKAQPANPIDFFAKWLLQQSKVAKSQQQQEEKVAKTKECLEKFNENEKSKAKIEAAKDLVRQSKEQQIEKFNMRVTNSKDLTDELQNLVDHLKEFTDSTAVYVGKVTKPIKKIKESDNDRAHINSDAQP